MAAQYSQRISRRGVPLAVEENISWLGTAWCWMIHWPFLSCHQKSADQIFWMVRARKRRARAAAAVRMGQRGRVDSGSGIRSSYGKQSVAVPAALGAHAAAGESGEVVTAVLAATAASGGP